MCSSDLLFHDMDFKIPRTAQAQAPENTPINSGTVTRYDSIASVEDPQNAAKTFEKKTLRHIDARIVPLLGLLYSFALIDRSNLGIARVVGMGSAGSDMDLTIGNRFSLVLTLFYLPYTLLQLPSNLMLRKVGPRQWLGFCVLGWGAAQCAMGFANNWVFLVICRVFLGAFEAGFFPAQTLIVTTWYKRHEVQTRLAGFYVISIFASGFGPILAFMLSKLNGFMGVPGYAWIFFVEGSITMLLGALAWIFLPDFPDKNTFLRPKETAWVLERIEQDRGDSMPRFYQLRHRVAPPLGLETVGIRTHVHVLCDADCSYRFLRNYHLERHGMVHDRVPFWLFSPVRLCSVQCNVLCLGVG